LVVEEKQDLVETGEEVVAIQHSPIPQDPLLQKEEVVVDQDQEMVA
jgi:hypothetical protein